MCSYYATLNATPTWLDLIERAGRLAWIKRLFIILIYTWLVCLDFSVLEMWRQGEGADLLVLF